jgi:hypothetical protein
LRARNDPREVIPDPHARYLGIAPSEPFLLPRNGAWIGNTRFEVWMRNAQTPCPSWDSSPVAVLNGASP